MGRRLDARDMRELATLLRDAVREEVRGIVRAPEEPCQQERERSGRIVTGAVTVSESDREMARNMLSASRRLKRLKDSGRPLPTRSRRNVKTSAR